METPLYGTFSGAAFNCNKMDNTFDINAPQYVTFYCEQCHLSTMPVCGHFDDLRCCQTTLMSLSKASSRTSTSMRTQVLHVSSTSTSTTSIFLERLSYPLLWIKVCEMTLYKNFILMNLQPLRPPHTALGSGLASKTIGHNLHHLRQHMKAKDLPNKSLSMLKEAK